jgi:proline dehydrogenase
MAWFDRAAIACLPLLPRPLMRVLSRRYIAGERLQQALDCLSALHADGFGGTLDILGEDVEDEAEARDVVEAYVAAAAETRALELDAYVSVKPTHVGLRLSEELCFQLYLDLCQRCAELDVFVRVEMEDHTTTDATLRVFERLRLEVENVGIVLQSRLHRTLDDIEALSPGLLNVRMVKGIYLEPAEIAHVDPEPIREAFVECTRKLFERGAFVALATHDEGLAQRLLAVADEQELSTDHYEFQVLLGVQERLWRRWLGEGYPVRVYVPFGPNWRAYSTRRLRKNPQIFRHLVRDFFSIGSR